MWKYDNLFKWISLGKNDFKILQNNIQNMQMFIVQFIYYEGYNIGLFVHIIALVM